MKFCLLKRIILIAALAFVTAALPQSAQAQAQAAGGASNYEKAVDLKILGLLASTPDNFDLERAPTRLEGAVMLVRLLGDEKEAKQGNYSHPFTDVPAWADGYIGYMYSNGLSNGIGGSLFGSGELLSGGQYLTFVLRSLGYSDKGDFSYGKVMDKALETGLLSASEASAMKKTSRFLRNDMVGISYNALSARIKGASSTLLDKLADTDRAVFKPAAKALGLYYPDLDREKADDAAVKNSDDLFKLIRKSLYLNNSTLNIDIRNYKGSATDDYEKAFDKAIASVSEITGVPDIVKSWEYKSDGKTLQLTFKYRYTKDEYNAKRSAVRAALDRARHIVAREITAGMPDYEKEKKLHDYIINTTEYDYKNYINNTLPPDAFDEYGCLVLGTAVCEGYADAMKLLCDLSGIECFVVTGEAKNDGSPEGHAWNIVRIDGDYYHLDVTNDDPVTDDGTEMLTYHYFNLPDSEMLLYNNWDRKAYPVCTSTKNSYYYKNDMVAESKAAFDMAVQEALKQRKAIIELKVMDYSSAKYSNLSEIIFRSNSVIKYHYTVNDEFGIIRIFNILYSNL